MTSADIEHRGEPKPRPWFRRASPGVLFAILLVPYVLIGSNFACHKVEPGERRPAVEVYLPAIGAPVALLLAVLSLTYGSWLRRSAVFIVGVLSAVAAVAAVRSLLRPG